MANPRSRSELFRRLFILCGSVALLGAVIATFAFYSYRAALTTDGLAAELTAQAHAIAPLADERLKAGDDVGAARLLRAFAGLHYVTCVELVRGDSVLAAFPPPGCDVVQAKGSRRQVAVTTASGTDMLFRAHVDDDLLMAPVWAETAFVGGLMIGLAAVIFIGLSLSFRKAVLAPLVVLRDAMQASTPHNPVRAELLHDDEIGAIVKAYNSLVAGARLFFRRLERSQSQLAESERRFRELAEVSGDWFFEMDSELRLSFISDRFFEITGLNPDEVIGYTRREIAADSNVAGDFDRHIADLEARREFRRFEYELAGGSKPVHVSISGVPVIDEQGNFQGYRGASIADLMQMQTEKYAHLRTPRKAGIS